MSPEFIERRELNYVQGELGDGGRRINTLPTDNREAIQALKPNVTSMAPFLVPANPVKVSC